eukprot:403361632
MELNSVAGFLVVGILWGTTNAFMEKGTKDKEQADAKKQSSGDKQQVNIKPTSVMGEVVNMFKNIGFLLPFIINQLASILNNFVLAASDLTIAVPAVNCITFIVTFITQKILNKESLIDFKFFGGCLLIMFGMYFCLTK